MNILKDNNNIVIKNEKGIKYLQFKKLLEYGIKHAYTLSVEGVDFSFKTSAHDNSYKMLADALDIEVNNIVEPVQTHTDEVRILEEVTSSDALQDVDGLITNKKNIDNQKLPKAFLQFFPVFHQTNGR